MTRLFVFTFVVSLAPLFSHNAIAQEAIPGPIATEGELLFEDDFQRNDLGEWKQILPGFVIKDGVLVGTQDKKEHGSVLRIERPMKDLVMQFRFKLAGSPRFNLVFDDKNHKGSHAGHIVRVAYAMKQIRLGDDREGIMKNEIFKMKRDPKQDQSVVAKLLEGRGANAKVSLEQNQWYTTKIEIVDDQMRVSLDGKPIGYLKSPGLAHPTKQSVHFTVSGKAMHFDDVKICTANRTHSP